MSRSSAVEQRSDIAKAGGSTPSETMLNIMNKFKDKVH